MLHFLQIYFKGKNYSIAEETFAGWPSCEILTFRLSHTPEILVFRGNKLSMIRGFRYNENKLEHSKFVVLLKMWCFPPKNHGLTTKSGQWS